MVIEVVFIVKKIGQIKTIKSIFAAKNLYD